MNYSPLESVLLVLLLAFLWLLPILAIARSRKTTGTEKWNWIFAAVFVSWFAWIVYALHTPAKNKT